ncbi:MAG: methyltransferase domain-containing protein [Salinivirgaceae bacterium]|jgi:ubiquinone/menaquinone biosynthesis C-methylase UbiE|nr:methyltransferase domain-containing protein [Salinivirgaceae bacterium]
MHLNSKLLFEKHALKYFENDLKVLEVGPTGYPSYYNRIVNSKAISWYTLDFSDQYIGQGEKNPLHIRTDNEYLYPIEGNSFDIVLSGQVMEHVQDIWKWLDELKRITKEGGVIILISPISWVYHEAPIDCWRIYPEGMKLLMKEKGLKVHECSFGSLEKEILPKHARTIPGTSILNLDGKISIELRILLLLQRIPIVRRFAKRISISYDTICISEKQNSK